MAGLHKSFGDTTVLRGLDLEVPEGTVYALLGPNGAGKTTVVNICCTLPHRTPAWCGWPAMTCAPRPIWCAA